MNRIDEILTELGIGPNLLGFGYIKRALEIGMEDEHAICRITTIYKTIGMEKQFPAYCIERGIRSAIKVCWNRCKEDTLFKYFPKAIYTKSKSPKNAEFIGFLLMSLRTEEPKDEK